MADKAGPEMSPDDLRLRNEIDDAWIAYFRRQEQGDQITIDEFVEQYPHISEDLREALEFSEEFEKKLEESPPPPDSSWVTLAMQFTDDEPEWPCTGDTIAGLELLAQLGGESSQTRVFEAREIGITGRNVVAKFCRMGSPEADHMARIGLIYKERKIPEQRMVAICMPLTSRATLHDVLRRVGESDERPASAQIVWDEIREKNNIQDDRSPAWAQRPFVTWALELMKGLAESLTTVAAAEVVHCDLKPTNVIVTMEGVPSLVDFDLAVRSDEVARGGTWPYMAPEQLSSFEGEESRVDARTDIYGLAATVYQLLTGELPFETPPGGDVGEILKRRENPPQPIRERNPHVSPALDSVIRQCLSYAPEDRPQSAADLVAQLNRVKVAPVGGQVQAATEAIQPSSRRVTAVAVSVAVSLVMTVAFAVIWSPGFPSQLTDLSIASPDSKALATADITITPESAKPDIGQMLNEAYDAFEAGEYEAAVKKFLRVLEIDAKHEGAAFGCARAYIKLNDCNLAMAMATRIPEKSIPELYALRGMCYAGVNLHQDAVAAYKLALARGFNSQEVLLNYGHSQHSLRRYKEAIETFEKARDMGGDVSTVNLTLAATYSQFWGSQSKGGFGPAYDTSLMVSLLEESPECPERFLTAASLYADLALRFAPMFRDADPVRHEYWAKRSLDEFKRGVEIGLDPNHWHVIAFVQQGKANPEELFPDYTGSKPDNGNQAFENLRDPFGGTNKYARCADQAL